LQAVIVADGPVIRTGRGVRPHPALAEERQVSLALGRLLAQLEIPAEQGEEPPGLRSGASARASKAARARWGIRDAREGR
jgi:hypothetical protein